MIGARRTLAAVAVLLSAAAGTGHAQADSTAASRPCARCLQAALPGMIDSAKVPGLAAAVIRDGRVAWSGGVGHRDVATRQPMTAETVIRGASLGKPVFAYAVLKLVDQGRIALDTPLVRYAPRAYIEQRFLKGPMTDTLLPRITARMVLSHTSGLPNWRPPGEAIRVHFAPGSRYSLSGEGLTLLQRVVEHLTGQRLEPFMQSTVLRPLGMTRTTYAAPAANAPDVATAYGRDGAPVVPAADEEPNAAHTIRTTASDYARFVAAVMRGEGLRPATHREMLRAQSTTDICRSEPVSWSLAFAVEPSPRGDAFVAWGKSPDANAYLFGIAGTRDAVFYLTNTAANGMAIGQKVVKLTFGRDDPLLGCFGVKSYDAPR